MQNRKLFGLLALVAGVAVGGITPTQGKAAFYYEGLAPFVCDKGRPDCPSDPYVNVTPGSDHHVGTRPKHKNKDHGEKVRTQTRENTPQK